MHELTMKQLISRLIDMDKDTDLLKICNSDRIGINHWGWISGVGLFSLVKHYIKTKDENLLYYLEEWFDKNIQIGIPGKTVNTICPLLTLVYLYELKKNDAYLDLCIEWAEWIIHEMPRTQEMGLQHITVDENYQQLWDDTLFVAVLFLAKLGMILNNETYVNEAVRQYLVHVKYLVDRKNGLFFHGWTFDGCHHFGEAHWARGNCWYTVGVVELFEILGSKLDGAARAFLQSTLEAQVNSLKKYQNENGMWSTLIDDQSSYDESSATAAFAYGILKAVNDGILDKSYFEVGEKASKAVLKRIDDSGTVLEVSFGTPMGHNIDFYKEIPICPMAYGQAFAILLVNELQKIK